MNRINFLFAATVLLCVMAFMMPPSVMAGLGTTGTQILDLGGGTRATALGDAFAAISGDVTTALWNPSGLGVIQDRQFALSYKDQGQIFGDAGEGLYYAFFAGAWPLGDAGTLSSTLQLQGQGTIGITVDSPEVIREENLGTNWAWTVSYADRLSDKLLAGVSGKIIQMKLAQESGRAYAIDLGAQYDLLAAPLPVRLGATVQNWGTDISFKDDNQSDSLPRRFRSGAAVTVYEDRNHQLTIIGDLTASIHKLSADEDEVDAYLEIFPDRTRDDALSDQGVGIHAFEWRHLEKSVGVEYWLGKLLAIRVGYQTEPGVDLLNFTDHITYGLGVRLLNYQFDYAAEIPRGPEGKRLNVFALLLRF